MTGFAKAGEKQRRRKVETVTTLYFDNEYNGAADPGEAFGFSCPELARMVVEEVLRTTACPFDAEVSLTLTGDGEMQSLNRETRGIDRTTDVLSFPVCAYQIPGNYREAEEDRAGCFNPETGALMLGDIVISVPRMLEQAEAFGHPVKREFAFLTAHSTLHLAGWDHMTEDEEEEMFALQEKVLQSLGLGRDA